MKREGGLSGDPLEILDPRMGRAKLLDGYINNRLAAFDLLFPHPGAPPVELLIPSKRSTTCASSGILSLNSGCSLMYRSNSNPRRLFLLSYVFKCLFPSKSSPCKTSN